MSWVQYVLVALILSAMAALVVYRTRVQSGTRDLVTFLGEVRGEITKITWPTKDELRRFTITILFFVTVVAIIIGAMDLILQWLLVQLPGSVS